MIILIVDKEKRWANHVKKLLESEKHEVKILKEYKKAIERTQKTNFDLIFYDSQLFNENQKYTSELIMQKPNNRVVITSAMPNFKEAMCAKRHGAVDYIDKSYDYDELLKIIAKNIKTRPISREYLKRILMEEEVCL